MKIFIKLFSIIMLMLFSGYACTIPLQNSSTSNGSLNSNGYNSQPESLQSLSDQKNSVPENKSQIILDSAIEFYQASIEFWQQGDIDNALAALDKAYSLILEVNLDSDPDIFQQREDLRVTIAKRIVEVYASRTNKVNGYKNEIPLVMNKEVEKAIKSLTGRDLNFFLNSYKRSGRFRPAIVEALRAEGLPEELSWLPLIESGYKTRALSSARALGMWQFIASTGYKFGLERTEWVDERMNPDKATIAAIAYLKELHGIFGDWTTALAAYNCGEGRVLRTIKRQRISYLDDFWDLYAKLPRETASYVPRFIAVLHIVNDPKKYGVELPQPDSEVKVETVTINKQVHLKTIASKIGVPHEELRSINTELRKQVTPNTPYALNLPEGKTDIFKTKLSEIPVYVPPVPAYIVHRVKSGESLSVIASKYNSSTKAIMRRNNLKKSSFIKAGWKLKIPTKSWRSSAKKSPRKYTVKDKGNMREYAVRRGDSLWEIARSFNTTTKAIKTLNNLKTTKLRIGQVLLLPKTTVLVSIAETEQYKVKNGDSPYLIAKRHKMKLSDLLKLNNLTPRSMIFPGQSILVKAK